MDAWKGWHVLDVVQTTKDKFTNNKERKKNMNQCFFLNEYKVV